MGRFWWNLEYQFVEKLSDYKLIATGNNNTARYLEYYIRCLLSEKQNFCCGVNGNRNWWWNKVISKIFSDILVLGCRNVTTFYYSKDFELGKLFEIS